MKTSLAIAVAVLVAGGLTSASSSGSTPAAGRTCAPARIGGKRVCLAVGARCTARYDSAYRSHGFRCSKGKLVRLPKPKPPAIATVVAKIAVPMSTAELAAGEGAVWAIGDDAAVRRIDPGTNTVTATIPTAPDQEYLPWIALGGGALWISNFTDGTVWRVDAATAAHTATISVSPAPEGIAVTPNGVWVATHHGNPTGSLTRIDPATNAVTGRTAVGAAQDCCGPQGLAATTDGVWSTVPNLDAVVRVDPASGAVAATIPAPPACGPVSAATDAVWVASGCDVGSVYRIDPATNKLVATVRIAGIAADVAVGSGAVWVLALSLDPNSGAGTLVRIDPATNHVVGTLAVPDAAGVAVLGDSVYVGSGHSVWRIRPT